MCIRDRLDAHLPARGRARLPGAEGRVPPTAARRGGPPAGSCLLYTSDAADERSSVDLGGRRIINKKTNTNTQLTMRTREVV